MKRILSPLCAYSFVSSVFESEKEICNDEKFKAALKKSTYLIKIFREKTGIPGISVHVNISGKSSVDFSYGYSDVENLTKCKIHSLMRIASISKSFTSLIAAQLIDEGLLDLDKDINEYLPDFPVKTFQDKKVKITCRQLLSHRSGIRSYKSQGSLSEYNLEEFLNAKHCNDSLSTRKCFENDPLVYAPGEKFFYSVYGYVLLGSVLEKVAEKSVFYSRHIKNLNKNTQALEKMFEVLFDEIGLENTFCEYNDKILSHRSKQYRRNCSSKCSLEVAPFVDNSCKWAAGGIISTCHDLSRMAQTLVEIWLGRKNGILSKSSLQILWKPIPENDLNSKSKLKWKYGLGWCIKEKTSRIIVGHLGGACGGTSALIINLPKGESREDYVIVTILCNMEYLSEDIGDLAFKISNVFLNKNSKKIE